jgi:hypothetical protein
MQEALGYVLIAIAVGLAIGGIGAARYFAPERSYLRRTTRENRERRSSRTAGH